jgi:hypothetical protein
MGWLTPAFVRLPLSWPDGDEVYSTRGEKEVSMLTDRVAGRLCAVTRAGGEGTGGWL